MENNINEAMTVEAENNTQEIVETVTETMEEVEAVETAESEQPTDLAEETAAEIEAQKPAFFAWDEDYSREKKTRYSRMHKFLIMLSFIVAGVAILLVDSYVLPEDPNRNSLLGVALALIFVAAVFIPQFTFKKRFHAMFISFIEADGKFWRIKLRPRTVRSKHGHARQQRYINETFAVAHDESVLRGMITSSQEGTLRGTDSFPRPRVAELDSVTAEQNGKKIKCTYMTESGRQKEFVILDCYPGLVEYINNK